MRVLIQRVSEASVEVNGRITGQIGTGLLVFVGISKADNHVDAEYLAGKTAALRIFPDEEGKMNRNVDEARGAILAISQFTLYGDCRRGRRPSFDDAAPPAEARALYDYFVEALRRYPARVETGVFQAAMAVRLVNDGPVTILIDSAEKRSK